MNFLGYSLINLETKEETQFWACNDIPPYIMIDGKTIMPVELDIEYSGHILVQKIENDNKPSKWHSSTGQTTEFDGTNYIVTITYPEQPNLVPDTVSNFQGRSILVLNGLDEVVNNAINSIENETERKLAQLAWEKGSFDRNSPLLNNIMFLLGKNDNFRDQLFRDAADIFV